MCDAGQSLVEGGRVAVVRERDTHSCRQEPSGQSERLLVLQEPASEALIVHLVTLATTQNDTARMLVCPNLTTCSRFLYSPAAWYNLTEGRYWLLFILMSNQLKKVISAQTLLFRKISLI